MRTIALLIAMLGAAPALAEADELPPIAPANVAGVHYAGTGIASQIEFINLTRTAVQVNWVAFDGTSKPYGVIPAGAEVVQPTYVSHRWIVTRPNGVPIQAFISTRADVHGDGQPQIAIVR